MTDDEANIDLVVELGAAAAASHQVLRLYIPDCDRQGEELGSQRKWVLEAAELLARIGGGVTIEPPVEGGWWDPVQGKIVWERPVLVYTYINPDEFLRRLPDLREFLHRLGRETNQGEVALEFDGVFFRIWSYDEP